MRLQRYISTSVLHSTKTRLLLLVLLLVVDYFLLIGRAWVLEIDNTSKISGLISDPGQNFLLQKLPLKKSLLICQGYHTIIDFFLCPRIFFLLKKKWLPLDEKSSSDDRIPNYAKVVKALSPSSVPWSESQVDCFAAHCCFYWQMMNFVEGQKQDNGVVLLL